MNFFTILPLISAVCVFALGFFVYYKNRRSLVNFTFFLFCLAITIWMFGTFMMFLMRDNPAMAAFWDRVVYSGVIFIPAIMLSFALAITKNNKFNARFGLMVIGYITSLIFLPIVFSPQFVNGVFVYEWGIHTKAQVFHHIFLAYFVVYLSFFFYIVGQYYFKIASGLEKLQIRYIFLAFFILAIFGSMGYLPAYGVSILPFSYLSGLVFSLIIAYAILKYRLMDMRIVARAFLVYFADSVYVFLFYCSLLFALPLIWGSVYSYYSFLAGIVIAPVFVLSIFYFDRLIKFILDKYFFYALYDFQRTISKLSSELNNYSDLDKIINLIVDTIKEAMGLNRAGVLLIDKKDGQIHYKIAKVIGFDITNGISLVQDTFLTRYLKKSAKPLVREELLLLARDTADKKQSTSFLNLEKEMRHIEAYLCLPLISGKELFGIIVLGRKHSGDPYTQEDLNLLSTLANQAGIAIDNARLYAESKNFNKLLQRKVDEQTKELKARAIHLEKLLKMREEFLDIASHQLKTPISVIRGTISMFKDGSMDKLPKEEQKKFLDNIYHKTEKLNVIIADILRASEIDTEDFKIDPKTAQKARVEDILKSVYDDLKEMAQDKKVKLSLNLPAKPTPQILTSIDFLEQAFYNLVDNAIKYTNKGEVKVDLSVGAGEVIIKVSDNGIGIPENDQKKMFEKFSRAKNAVNMYTDGSGLGLFIVKRIIEAHSGGIVGFKSVLGQGTVFTVKLKTVK